MPKSVTFDRDQVMKAVVELFWKKGYNGTSIQDLVDATGLNRSSFYNSFNDKFSLFEESLKYYQEKQFKWISEFENVQSPKQAIISLFKGITTDIVDGNQKGCFIANCTTELVEEPKVRELLQHNKDRLVSLFASLIIEAQKRGEISTTKKPDTLALYLFSSLQGLRVTSMIDTHLQGVTEEILGAL